VECRTNLRVDPPLQLLPGVPIREDNLAEGGPVDPSLGVQHRLTVSLADEVPDLLGLQDPVGDLVRAEDGAVRARQEPRHG